MGLNLSSAQIARELDLNEADVQQMIVSCVQALSAKNR
jgi:hypothetical protein